MKRVHFPTMCLLIGTTLLISCSQACTEAEKVITNPQVITDAETLGEDAVKAAI